jgi:hypothetical protein
MDKKPLVIERASSYCGQASGAAHAEPMQCIDKAEFQSVLPSADKLANTLENAAMMTQLPSNSQQRCYELIATCWFHLNVDASDSLKEYTGQ